MMEKEEKENEESHILRDTPHLFYYLISKKSYETNIVITIIFINRVMTFIKLLQCITFSASIIHLKFISFLKSDYTRSILWMEK